MKYPLMVLLLFPLTGYGQQQPPGAHNQAPSGNKPKVERRKRAEEKADSRALYTIEGKVRPPDEIEIERDKDGKEVSRIVYESEVRELAIKDVVEFESPNLQGKWSPNPITPVDVGWAYLVQRIYPDKSIAIQPRVITKDGMVMLGRAFVIKGYDTTGLKAKTLTPLTGKYKLVDTTKNKTTGTVFFVFEVVVEGTSKKK